MITVIDALMGAGKTSFAIQYINDHPEENILYITPYLDEDKRVADNVNCDMQHPTFKHGTKFEDLLNLLQEKENIASTHALFMRLDDSCRDILINGQYTLILDETINVVEPYNLKHRDDIKYLLENGSIRIADDGRLEWLGGDIDTSYNKIKTLAEKHTLYFIDNTLLVWCYPPEIFKLFPKVFIMTYMFKASILRYYLDLINAEYEIKSLKKSEGQFYICDYFKPDLSLYRAKIHVYIERDLTENFTQKESSLSATWLRSGRHEKEIDIIRRNIYNYFTNKEPAKGKQIIWTTLKDCQDKLKGKGYTLRFVSHNYRATNNYSEATHLCYALNKYLDPGVIKFFSHNGIRVNQDLYALSEMLQWIWRSAIRNDEDIYIYIPSKRMRRLLLEWLDEKYQ